MLKMLNKIKELIRWIAIDGYMHLTTAWLIFLILAPMIEWYALVVVIGLCILKEVYDIYIKKSNNFNQALHDLICDGVGMFAGVIIYIIHCLL